MHKLMLYKLIVNVTVFMFILISSAAMYNVNPSNVILVHDDLDKPVGKYSLKNGGSAGWDVIVLLWVRDCNAHTRNTCLLTIHLLLLPYCNDFVNILSVLHYSSLSSLYSLVTMEFCEEKWCVWEKENYMTCIFTPFFSGWKTKKI